MASRASAIGLALLVAAPAVSCRPAPVATQSSVAQAPSAAALGAAAVAPPSPAGLGELRQPAPILPSDSSPSRYEVGEFPLRASPLRPGLAADRQLVDAYCGVCHSTVYIANQPPLSRAVWQAEVSKMRNAFGASLPDDAALRIVDYLATTYGPQP